MNPNEDYAFQQDGAISHANRAIQSYLEDSTPSFIKKNEWTLQSPDCNPMVYGVWDSLQVKFTAEGRLFLKKRNKRMQ